MSRAEGRWGNSATNQPLLGEHQDYRMNLSIAQNFIHKVTKSLLEGMDVKLEDKNMVLVIAYRPPYDAPMGNYAAPVSLHQAKYNFENEMTHTFNAYYKMAKEANERYRPQPRQGHLQGF